MKKYGYYSKLTGLYYVLTDHAKLRMWERFETLDIETEFKEWCRAMTRKSVDDIIANMNFGDEVVFETLENCKIYVVILNDDMSLCLKTCYKNSCDSRFKYAGTTHYKVWPDYCVTQ